MLRENISEVPNLVQWTVDILAVYSSEVWKNYILLFFVSVSFLFIAYLWFRFVRNPKGRGLVVNRFSPPDGITPIEAGYLVDEKVDKRDLAAEILYLDIKDILDIEYSENTFKLVRKKSEEGRAAEFDKELIRYLFGDQQILSLYSTSEFNKVRADSQWRMRNSLNQGLKDKGYFVKSSFWLAFKQVFIFLGLMFLVQFGAAGYLLYLNKYLDQSFIMSNLAGPLFYSFFFSILAVGIVGISSFWVLSKVNIMTKEGMKMREKILGLKEYLKVAEKERLDFHQNPNKRPKDFNLLLPYAVALGVDKNWSDLFSGLFDELDKLERVFYEEEFEPPTMSYWLFGGK